MPQACRDALDRAQHDTVLLETNLEQIRSWYQLRFSKFANFKKLVILNLYNLLNVNSRPTEPAENESTPRAYTLLQTSVRRARLHMRRL